MASFASSYTSGWSQGEDAGWRSGTSSMLDATAAAERCAPQPTSSRDMWFYSTAQRQLAPATTTNTTTANNAVGAAPPATFGVAAVALRQRPRPVSADVASLVRFDVLPSSMLTATMGLLRGEANGRPSRVRQQSHAPHLPHDAARASLRVTDGASPSQDAVGRLVSALNECEQAEGPRPTSAGRRSLHHSAASVLPPHPPSDRSRRDFAKAALPSHVAHLTKRWVTAEREEAAAQSADSAGSSSSSTHHHRRPVVRMPAQRPVSAHAAPLANSSCVMRLRKSKFEPLPQSTVEASFSALPGSLDGEPPSSATELERRLLAEPLRSYRVLKDATTAPVEPHPSSHIPLLEASRLRRANLERLAHNFEHQRYVLHGELEDALMWRGQCQAAVLRRRSTDDSLPTGPQPRTEGDVYQGLLDEVFARRSHLRPKTAHPAPVRCAVVGFRSVWTKEAMRQALDEEKGRLTRLLQAFESKCGAAALTLAAMEDFRAETIKRVWHPEEYVCSRGSAVFYREHFLKYVQLRFPSILQTLSSVTADVRQPSDVFDALPSKAEASFAKFVYETLPSFATPA